MAKKPELKKTTVQRSDFSYQQGDVTLNFNLRVDTSSELRVFKTLLDEASKDLGYLIAGMKN